MRKSRKITQQIIESFEQGISKTIRNTSTDGNGIFLHGNKIAEWESMYKDDNKNINITLSGWNTVTTRERLNGLQGVHVTTKKGQAYLNGIEWNGDWITIKQN